jgi:hypothetical protein
MGWAQSVLPWFLLYSLSGWVLYVLIHWLKGTEWGRKIRDRLFLGPAAPPVLWSDGDTEFVECGSPFP